MIHSSDVVREVRKLATENPEKVYDTQAHSGSACLNVHTDNEGNFIPGCLIGTALVNLGVSYDSLYQVNNSGTEDTLNALQIHRDERDVRWLASVQDYQDIQYQWGVAVKLSDTAFLIDIDE